MADSEWWRQAVVYQVYPRSFSDSDGDGLGDLRGVTSRLGHLVRLGVDALWLSPFYPSPLADGGYDVVDHRDVDPRLGTVADVEELVTSAHAAGLRVIVDIVPNHTSSEHRWFRDALRDGPGSPARDRYVFRPGRGQDGELPPSDWESSFGGSAWERVDDGAWYLHLYAPEQPDLNWQNEEVREDFLATLRFWADRGVDGFRVDVAHALVKDLREPLRSQRKPLDHDLPVDGSDPLYDRDDVHEIYRAWRAVFDEYDPPRSAVAEAWVPAERRAAYARREELGQAFNFDLLEAPWSAPHFEAVITKNLAEAAQAGTSSTWVLSNHDVVRHPSRYGLPADVDLDAWLMSDGTHPPVDRAQGTRRARAAALLLMALPGSVYLYQGEELGLFEVADLARNVLQDPKWERTGYRRKGRDGCRVPLPWHAAAQNFGFGSGQPWLPQPGEFVHDAASVQDGRAGSVLELYREALGLRRSVQRGEELSWRRTDQHLLEFSRHEGWAVAVNFGADPVALPTGRVLLSSGPLHLDHLPGETAVWFRPS